MVARCLEDSSGIELTNRALNQAQLGLKFGGLGLRSLHHHSSAAYLSSITSVDAESNDLLKSSADIYNTKVKTEDNLDCFFDAIKGKSQRSLSSAIDKKSLNELVESAPSICDKARLLAVTEQHTSDWIAAIPSPGLGLKLEANEFQTLIKMRLGLDIYDGQSNCPLCLDKTLDKFGYHALTCRKGPNVVKRHNTLRDTLFEYCRHALLNPKLEQGSGLDHAHSQTRPADILIPVWSLAQSAALDITVVHPLNPDNVIEASTSTIQCLDKTEVRKHRENDEKCSELGWKCVPIVVTAYGGYGSEALNCI